MFPPAPAALLCTEDDKRCYLGFFGDLGQPYERGRDFDAIQRLVNAYDPDYRRGFVDRVREVEAAMAEREEGHTASEDAVWP